MPKEHIYLDNHATTPMDERVLKAMLPYFVSQFGNASSGSHKFGWDAERAVKRARTQVADLLGARSPREIVFTSGATESNNLALSGVLEARAQGHDLRGLHIITSAIEHPCVLQTCEALVARGASVTKVRVGSDGLVPVSAVEAAIRPETVLISIMAVNNEIGTIQPVSEIGALARSRGVLFHCDAAQAAGRISIDVERDQIDLLSLSAHKLYGPKGTGALYVRRGRRKVELTAQQHGGGQEMALRSGTLNVPGIVGLGAAAELAQSSFEEEEGRLLELRNLFLVKTARRVSDCEVNGCLERRVAGNLSLRFSGVSGEALIAAVPSLAFSVGSACSTIQAKPSHVLSALRLNRKQIRETIRLGFGRFTTEAQVCEAAEQISAAVTRLRVGFGRMGASLQASPL